MRLLLDTHVFLWWITDDPRLSDRAREHISDRRNRLYLSAASGWEIAIKSQLGRLKFPDQPMDFVLEQMTLNEIEELPIRVHHALYVFFLPAYHRDPFDRLLIAQAKLERLVILTADLNITRYDVRTLW